MKKRKNQLTTEQIAIIALLIAFKLVLSRFSVPISPENRLSFGFLGTALLGTLYGPWIAGFANAGSDLLSSAIFGSGGQFFIGFTFSAFLGGVFYGVFLYRDRVNWYHILLAVLCNSLITNLFLNTLWVHWLYKTPIIALLLARIPQNLIMGPLRFGVIYLLLNAPQLQGVLKRLRG